MLVKLHPALILTLREVRDQLRDWRIIIPIVVLTLIFPSLMNFTARQLVGFVQRYGAPLIGDRLIPFLLMVVGFFPISVSLVIALESFVGEKERHSIEPLLACPLSDWQLYLGKLLSALVAPLLASYLGICVYLIGVYRQVGWKPDPVLLLQVLALTTVQALVMVSGAVVVSTQTTSIRAANLLSSFIIIPMTFLIQGESVVMFWGSYHILWLVIFGQIVISALLIRTGVAHFNREELLGHEYDSLDMRNSLRTFWRAFHGQSCGLGSWFKQELPATLRRLRLPMTLATLLICLGMVVGATQTNRFSLPAHVFNLENLSQGFIEGLEAIRFFSIGSITNVFWHNLRAVALASLLGVFTFGVLGAVVLITPLMLAGYFTAAAAQAGVSPWLFLGTFFLPHGVFEISALVVACAAILQLGATLAAPAPGRTIGEAWLYALADWCRVMLTVVIPLLLLAAITEVLVTPQVVLRVFG